MTLPLQIIKPRDGPDNRFLHVWVRLKEISSNRSITGRISNILSDITPDIQYPLEY